MFQEAEEKQLALSSSKAVFYENNRLGRSCLPHVENEDPKARRGKGTSSAAQPGAPSEQGPLQVSGKIRRATKLSDAQSVLIFLHHSCPKVEAGEGGSRGRRTKDVCPPQTLVPLTHPTGVSVLGRRGNGSPPCSSHFSATQAAGMNVSDKTPVFPSPTHKHWV